MRCLPRTTRSLRPSGSGVVIIVLIGLLAISGGSAWAAATIGAKDIKDNAIRSHHIKDGKVKAADLGSGSVNASKIADSSVRSQEVLDGTLTGTDVADNSLTGSDINESALAQVPDAAKLGGKAPSGYLSSTVYRTESATIAGTALGDGTYYIDKACNAGDLMLSGGPANVDPDSVMVESFPTPGSLTSWRARILPGPGGGGDTFSVVVLCVDQP